MWRDVSATRPIQGGCDVTTSIKRRVAACQALTSGDIETSLSLVLEFLEEAHQQGIDLVAFPEGTLFGYEGAPDYWERRRPEEFAAAEEAVRERCRNLGVAAVVGTASRPDGTWLNEVIAIDADGSVRARYGKTYLAGEKWCRPYSGRLPVVSLIGVECCFAICHDIRYPELIRLPAMAGARLAVFCSNESGLFHEEKLSAYQAMPIARATENDIFLLMANAPADPNDLHRSSQSHGNSKVIHPSGNVLVEAGFFTSGLIATDVDFADAGGRYPRNALARDSDLARWWRAGLRLVDQTHDVT